MESSLPQTHRQTRSSIPFVQPAHVPFQDDDPSVITTHEATRLNRKHTAITRNETSLARVCQQDNTQQVLRQNLTRGVRKQASTAICDNLANWWRAARRRTADLLGCNLGISPRGYPVNCVQKRYRDQRNGLRLKLQKPVAQPTVFRIMSVARAMVGWTLRATFASSGRRGSVGMTGTSRMRTHSGLCNRRHHVTTNTQPVRKRMSARMPQQRKDNPDIQQQ